ncbi:MAG: geranylgeranylglyceryl/heptaprenylglyceryl phosphate synthase [Cytophagaceae bacterium]|jgi:putative glycerol-1-phosphate prenyltransferase|nr:geranylgeranylglyceryl/heptaprenylglyceryl phosphate synthase [Cytophagaceae bacterium]
MSEILATMIRNKQEGKKSFAVLLDPDKLDAATCLATVQRGIDAGIDYFFVGGSLLVKDVLEATLHTIKQHCQIPVVLFPGSTMQISRHADALLFLSLISGRNADALIGQHVIAAPYLKQSGLEVISTGYMLVDCGKPTTVSYISNTTPIPYDKPEIAACTGLAGEMLGLKVIYLDGGSGAAQHISEDMIRAVSSYTSVPLIVGGGINTTEKIEKVLKAGADIVVIGNGIEKDPGLIQKASKTIHNR